MCGRHFRTCKPAKLCGLAATHSSKFCAILVMVIAVSGCGAPSLHDAQAVRGQVFGTSYALKLACSLDSVEARSIVESAFDRVDIAMSTYRQDSEVMRLNRSALGSWLVVSEDFARVAAASISLARFTGGAFDPTVGALVDLWGFSGGNVPDQVPTDSDIQRLQSNSGWRHLELDTRKARYSKAFRLLA